MERRKMRIPLSVNMSHSPSHYCSDCHRSFASKQCLDRHDLKIHPKTIEVMKAHEEEDMEDLRFGYYYRI